MLRGFDVERHRDIVFIPVGLNYDRVLEDRSLIRNLDPKAKKRSRFFVVRTVLGFAVKHLFMMMFNSWRRFGYACVNFGDPFSMAKYCRDHQVNLSRLPLAERHLEVEKLCLRLMEEIREVIPVLPVALVSRVMLDSGGQAMSSLEVKARVQELIERLEAVGGQVYHPARGPEKALEEALSMLCLRKLVVKKDDLYRAAPDSAGLFSYYANSIDRPDPVPRNR